MVEANTSTKAQAVLVLNNTRRMTTRTVHKFNFMQIYKICESDFDLQVFFCEFAFLFHSNLKVKPPVLAFNSLSGTSQ